MPEYQYIGGGEYREITDDVISYGNQPNPNQQNMNNGAQRKTLEYHPPPQQLQQQQQMHHPAPSPGEQS